MQYLEPFADMSRRPAETNRKRTSILLVFGGVVMAAWIYGKWVVAAFLLPYWQTIQVTQFLFCLLLLIAVIVFSDIRPLRLGWFALWTVAYSATIAASSTLAGMPINAWGRDIFYFAHCAIYLSFFSIVGRSATACTFIIRFLILLALLNGAITVWGAVTHQSISYNTGWEGQVGFLGYNAHTGRSGGLQGENVLGAYEAPSLAWGFLTVLGAPWYPWSLFVTALSGAAVVASFSRTAWLCGIATLGGSMFIGSLRGLRVWRIGIGMLVMMVILFSLVQFTQSALRRMGGGAALRQQSRFNVSSYYSWNDFTSGRIAIFRDAFNDWLASPLLGEGSGATFRTVGKVPHNAFLQILSETGLIGFIIFWLPPVVILGRLWRRYPLLRLDPHLQWATVVTIGLFPVTIAISSQWEGIIWLVLGLICGRLAAWQQDFNMSSAATDPECVPAL